jgi:hypothetical protein
MILNTHNSFLYYEDNLGVVDDYYKMIVELVNNFLLNNPEISVNVTICNNNYKFNNENKTIKIDINFEHTLVKKTGRDTNSNTTFGKITYDDNNYYLIRINNYDVLDSSDIVIDYSVPNIENVKSNELFNSFSNKHIYISPCIYKCDFRKENRYIPVLTTFINVHEERRESFLKSIEKKNIQHVNVNNCFDTIVLEKLYKSTKILINIHQTYHHDTVEELRILPALQCGVIVICEKSPLYELIPYNDLIIWVEYDKILEETIEIINNYDFFYNFIFTEKNINKLKSLNNINSKILSDTLLNICL